jgi:hypothetical protein
MDSLLDKSKWPNGPWFEEPDKAYWRDPTTGYFCSIKRNPMGSLCGYVHLRKTHPAFLGDYDHIEVDCPGGLTFGRKVGSFFVIGFDCAHYTDYSPGMAALVPKVMEGCHYWTFKEVKAEVESLAKQLMEMECPTNFGQKSS